MACNLKLIYHAHSAERCHMKKLSTFLYFDFESFSEGKQYMCTGITVWKDHDTNAVLGTKVEAAIVKDQTDYGANKEGEKVTNLFEKLVFKVPKKIDIPLNVGIVPINPVASVYGEYRNQLSITADDIEVVK